jgi:hypothetical protein
MKLLAQVVGMQSHLGSDCGFNSSLCPSRCQWYSKDCKNVLTQAITNPSCPSCVRHHISIIKNLNCHTMGKFGKPHYHHKAIVNLHTSKMEVIVYIAVRLFFLRLLCSQLHTNMLTSWQPNGKPLKWRNGALFLVAWISASHWRVATGHVGNW